MELACAALFHERSAVEQQVGDGLGRVAAEEARFVGSELENEATVLCENAVVTEEGAKFCDGTRLDGDVRSAVGGRADEFEDLG